MIRPTVYIVSGLLMLVMVITASMTDKTSFNDHIMKSAGAPPGSTGAPGEGSCAKSGCHADGTENVGPGVLSLIVGAGVSTYIPGTNYQVYVTLNHPNKNKFGFQSIALRDSDSSNIGELSLVEALRTQIFGFPDSTFPLFGRNYVTHTLDGNVAITPGWGEWSFYWTAPSSNVGDITIYLSTVAANINGDEFGDTVYTTSVTLSPDTVSLAAVGNPIDQPSVRLYPNPFEDKFEVLMDYEGNQAIQIRLYSLDGKLARSKIYPNNAAEIIFRRDDLLSGLYFFQVIVGETTIKSGKIIAL